ncbi:hypothetical protein [Nocardioides sp. GY 10113]|uniref:helix-turn-helix transcriptional regulator n=1 Tax=Nocardioides sp. GY 10113 TaxID=2569761 RepID=UPI001458BB2A|nr:hypothetical protein [Nocardioides sp. GY 10113]
MRTPHDCDCRSNASWTDRILDAAGVAAYLGVSPRHLADLRREDPGFPAPRMLGTLPRWSAQVLHDWIASPGSPGSAGGATDATAPTDGSNRPAPPAADPPRSARTARRVAGGGAAGRARV